MTLLIVQKKSFYVKVKASRKFHKKRTKKVHGHNTKNLLSILMLLGRNANIPKSMTTVNSKLTSMQPLRNCNVTEK